MQTLDQLLTANLPEVEQAFADTYNTTQWTKADRDARMERSKELIIQTATATLDFVRGLMDKEIEGRPLLFWHVVREMLAGELAFFESMRQELDRLGPEDLARAPVDYGWLTDNIRARLVEISEISAVLEQAAESGAIVEGL